MAWDYAPAPESRDVVSIRSAYGLFVDGEFVDPADGGAMKTIEYRITYSEGDTEIATVSARSINSGFAKAVKIALKPLGNGRVREISRVEFWMVR